ncbi:cytochrome P450 [Calocera cornea HHB12733]|uniref:Cytochrome P450 n=1 Tax=Calocera cornea HHB12733 TaxID=1353952 RepID=A0A165GTQ6_9BASI|nr:cytochrome P450 [Calocera cornea HHB12733]
MLYLGGILLLVLAIALAAVRDVQRKRSSRLPPGPPGLPLVGNALQLPFQFLWYRLDEWSKQYGSMYTIWLLGYPFIVLNSVDAASDVLDRLSAVTSDRPRFLKGQFFGTQHSVVSKNNTAEWRNQRKAIHANLGIRNISRFRDLQTYDAAHLALGLLEHPEKPFEEHIHRYAGSVIFRTLYGGDAFPHLGEDPSKIIEHLQKELLHALQPQNSVVDMLPFLKPIIERSKWLRRQGDNWYEKTTREATRLYEGAVPREGWWTIAHDFETNLKKYGMDKHGAVWVALTLYMAGQDTTNTALRVFALGILHNPDVMKAAEAQIDAVCGSRPPTLEDRENLPYIEALVKESVRWKPGVPMGVMHTASEDFEYRGYVIPEGTNFIDNIWGQTRDTAVYRDPEAFNPSRFLDASGKLLPEDTRSDLLGFGRGRRACPGRDYALSSLFIAISTMIWAFRFQWPVDANGNRVVCGVNEIEDHVHVATPRPFGVALKPRHKRLGKHLLGSMKESAARLYLATPQTGDYIRSQKF